MAESFLVTTDASDSSLPALRMGLRLAAAAGADVLVLHVVVTPGEQLRWSAPIFERGAKVYARLLEKQVAAAEALLRRQVDDIEDRPARVDIKVVTTPGSVSEMIVEMARVLSVALVVLGKGRKAQTLAAMSEQIARMTRCPVLIVPAKWTRRLRAPGRKPPLRGRTRAAPVARAAARR